MEKPEKKSEVNGESDNNNQKCPNDNETSNCKHHHRKRKKQFFNAIRNQMEFYFSDANLSKDRFLKKLIAEDPCKYHYYVHHTIPNWIDFHFCFFFLFMLSLLRL